MSDTAKIELKKPLTIDGAEVSVLHMREPLVADQLAVQKIKDPGDQEIALFSNLCQVTPDDIKRLTMRDYKKVQAAYQGFTD